MYRGTCSPLSSVSRGGRKARVQRKVIRVSLCRVLPSATLAVSLYRFFPRSLTRVGLSDFLEDHSNSAPRRSDIPGDLKERAKNFGALTILDFWDPMASLDSRELGVVSGGLLKAAGGQPDTAGLIPRRLVKRWF